MENHSDISKNFIPYELALELRNLGFDDYVFAFYWIDTKQLILDSPDYSGKHNGVHLQAPLWQQAFDWFLNRGYFADIKPDLIVTSLWSYRVVDINGKYNPENLHCYKFTYYRDARLECLKKLIKMVS